MTDKAAPTMHLKAHFDINQDSDQLVWNFVRHDHAGKPIDGPDAGSIYFTQGESFHIRVSGGSRTPFPGFEILDCTLVTRPQIYSCGPGQPTVYANPSPFVAPAGQAAYSAVIAIPPAEFKEGSSKKPQPNEIIKDWTGSLTASDDLARWEMSFIITVLIQRENAPSVTRVFCFDPETVIGDGVNPP